MKWLIKGYLIKEQLIGRLVRLWDDESGMGVIEIVVIIIVLIGLALLFRTRIETFLDKLFGEINQVQLRVNR